MVYKKTFGISYILLARVVLQDNVTYVKQSKSVSWWSARFAFKLQAVLSGPSEALRNFSNAQYQKSLFAYSSRPEILLEFGLVYHYYRDSQRAREYFLKAKAASKLYCELSGMLGRRTKFQSFDTAQLVLLAQSHEPGKEMPKENEASSVLSPSHYVDKDSLEAFLEKDASSETQETSKQASLAKNDTPKTLLPVELEADEEDIRLRAPKLVDDDETKTRLAEENLKVVDQCILLGLCLDVRNENPRHGLTSEQMKAYVERVMKHPNNWMVHSMALLIKSRLESNTSKYADRGAMQLQALADQYKDDESRISHPALVRCQRIFQVLYPPIYRLNWEIGDLYLRLGAARSAMDIFEELEMWNEVISALQLLEEPARARTLIRDRIAIEGETPELLCLMADLSESVEERIAGYTKCWEVSRGKFPKAKRQLAKISMDRRDFAGAIKHFRDALAVNPQYGFAWFRLGCCAIELGDWSQAQLAFTRCTFLHPDDAEAWSNLAAACLKLNKLKEAHSAFKEALKHNQENWRIWDNYMVVCIKLGHVQEAIYCQHKLIELNSSVDYEVLEILVNIAVTEFLIVAEDTDASNGDRKEPVKHSSDAIYVNKQLKSLFSKIVAQLSTTNMADLWRIFAKYYTATKEFALVIENRQKQVKALQVHGYESDAAKFEPVVKALILLVEDLEMAKDHKGAYSTLLQLKSLLKKSQDAFEGKDDYAALQALVPRLEAIKAAPSS